MNSGMWLLNSDMKLVNCSVRSLSCGKCYWKYHLVSLIEKNLLVLVCVCICILLRKNCCFCRHKMSQVFYRLTLYCLSWVVRVENCLWFIWFVITLVHILWTKFTVLPPNRRKSLLISDVTQFRIMFALFIFVHGLSSAFSDSLPKLSDGLIVISWYSSEFSSSTIFTLHILINFKIYSSWTSRKREHFFLSLFLTIQRLQDGTMPYEFIFLILDHL